MFQQQLSLCHQQDQHMLSFGAGVGAGSSAGICAGFGVGSGAGFDAGLCWFSQQGPAAAHLQPQQQLTCSISGLYSSTCDLRAAVI